MKRRIISKSQKKYTIKIQHRFAVYFDVSFTLTDLFDVFCDTPLVGGEVNN